MRRFAGYRSGEERLANRGGPFKAKAAQKVKSRAGGEQPAGPKNVTVEQTILFDDARSSENGVGACAAVCHAGALPIGRHFSDQGFIFRNAMYQDASWLERIPVPAGLKVPSI